MFEKNITEITDEIFRISYESIDESDLDEYTKMAHELLNTYEWPMVFQYWSVYLKSNCKNDLDVINFINLFYIYCDLNVCLPNTADVYDFLGYIYSKINLDKNWDTYGNLLDTFYNNILENAGYLDLMADPDYQFWKDKKILNSSKKYLIK